MRKCLPLSPKAMDVLSRQRQAFEEKFGRAPGPHDPLWFDPDLDVPVQIATQKMEDEIIVLMAEIAARPLWIWIYLKTGLFPSEENQSMMSAKDKHDVKEAGREYERDKPHLTPHISAAKERLSANAYYEKG